MRTGIQSVVGLRSAVGVGLRPFCVVVCLFLLCCAFSVQAQSLWTKANNTMALTVDGSWTTAGTPSTGDIALWTNTVTGANSVALAAPFSIGQIKIANPGGAVTINDQGNPLTVNGVSGTGIDLSVASQNLTLTTPLVLGGSQSWPIAAGRSVTLNGTNTIANGSYNVTVGGGGTLWVTYGNTARISAGQGAGGWVVNGSTLACDIATGATYVNLNNFLGTASSALTLAGATMSVNEGVDSGNHAQTFATLTLNPGASSFTIGRRSNSQFKTIFSALPVRNAGGVVNFPLYSSSTWVAIGGTSGTTMGYATHNLTDFAQTFGAAATVRAVTYVNDAWAAANNTTVTASSSPAGGSTTRTLRFGAAGAFTVTLAGLNTLSLGGLLVNATVGANTSTITGGSLTSGNTTSDGYHDLIVINNNTAGGDLAINSDLVDNGGNAVGLTKAGTRRLVLGGANTFTGPSYLSAGEVRLNSAGSWGGSSALSFAPNGTLAGTAATFTLNGNSVTVNGLAVTQAGIAPTVQNASATPATLTVNQSVDAAFSGTVRDGAGGGALGLSKNGDGTLTLGGTLSYSGATEVNAGTLRLTGALSASSPVTVGSSLDVTALSGGTLALTGSQTLCGAGSVAGAVSLGGGTTVAPGSGTAALGGAGVLTLGGLTLGGSSLANFGLDAADANACQASVGTLTLPTSGAVTLKLYAPGTSTPFAETGTYNLFLCTNLVNGTSLSSRFTIGTSIAGFAATYGTAAGPGGTTYVTLTLARSGTSGTWAIDADGEWSFASHWSSDPSVPSMAGDSAVFGVGTSLRTVTLDADETVGSIALNNANSFAVTGVNTLTLDNNGLGATINVSDGLANNLQTPLSLNDDVSVVVAAGKALAFSSSLSDGGAGKTITLSGAGTTSLLWGNNVYGPAAGSVGTTLSGGGVLRLGHSGALGTGDVSMPGNYTVQAVAADLSVGNNIGLAEGVTATLDSFGNNFVWSGTISGSGALIKTGGGALALGVANLYSGGITVSEGMLALSADGAGAGNAGNVGVVPAAATPNNVILNGGALLAVATTALHANRGIGVGPSLGSTGATAYLDANEGQTLTVNGVIASAGNTGANGLTVNSVAGAPGTVALAGANTFNGTTVVAGGTLRLANQYALQNSTLNYDNQGGALSFGTLTAATLSGLTGAQDLELVNDAAAAVTLTVGDNNASQSFSGVLSGSGSLRKAGTGTLALPHATYRGNTVVMNGGLFLAGPSNLTSHLDISAQQGVATVTIDGTIVTSPSGVYITSQTPYSGSAVYGSAANLTVTNGAQVVANADGNGRAISYGMGNGRPTGNGSLTVGRSGDTATLVTANGALDMFYTSGGNTVGNFTVNLNGGTLAVKRILETTSGSQSGTFKFNGGVLKALTNDMAVAFIPATPAQFTTVVNAGGAIIDDNGYSITVASALAHGTGTPDGGLTKLGAGTLTRSGSATYTGPTAVNAGTLWVNGTHAGGTNYTVAGGATLGGTGTVAVATGATVALQGDATLSPGFASGSAAGGALTLSSLTLAAAARFVIDATNDQVVVTGDLTLTDNAVTLADPEMFDMSVRYPILSYTGSGSISGTLLFVTNATHWKAKRVGNAFYLVYDGGTVFRML